MAPPDWVAEAVTLRSHGLTYDAIAAQVGVTKSSVQHWLNRDWRLDQIAAWKRRHGYRHPRRTPRGNTSSGSRRTLSDDMATAELKTTERITFRVPVSLAGALRAIAERNDRTLSDELRAALKQHVHATFTGTEEDPA